MKKIIILMVTLALLSGCSSNPQNTDNSSSNSTNNQPSVVATPQPDVTINISSEFLESMNTNSQDYVDNFNSENSQVSFKSVAANDDGSVTIVMDAATNKKFLDEFKSKADETIQELIADQTMTNISNISYNDDLTEFTILLKSDEMMFTDSMSSIVLYLFSGMYQIFSGIAEDKMQITINYVGSNKEVIESLKYPEN